MAILRGCSNLVIRCFKRVEHFADWITGAAGPVFVALCWILIGVGGLTFFDVVARDLSYPTLILLSPIFSLVPLNLYGQYWLVTHVPPGFPSPRAMVLSDKPLSTSREDTWINGGFNSIWRAEYWGLGRRVKRPLSANVGLGDAGKRVRRCRKCDGPKPERTHHCSVCKRCILLMDHHCPWINACVGLHNQRHFVLFMAWLSIACWVVSIMGYPKFWDTLEYRSKWPAYSPRIVFTLLWVLSIAIGIAVPVLLIWHIYMVSKGETSIEGHDNAYLEGKAKAEGLIYLNPYDLGSKKNLQQFFNIGPDGYPIWTLLFPFTIPPTSNGWSYPRQKLPADYHSHSRQEAENAAREALRNGEIHSPELAAGLVRGIDGNVRGKYVMGDENGLTDDEEGGGGYMD